MISNMNNINSTPAFQARLDVRTAVKNGKRLANIQELFAQKTTRYQDETLKLVAAGKDEGSDQFYLVKQGQKDAIGPHFLERSFDELMENLSDEAIAKKLVKFFKGLKLEGRKETAVGELSSHADRLQKLSEINAKRAEMFRGKGDIQMAERYETMSQQNLNKLEMVKEEQRKVSEKYYATIDKIAKGDPDLEYNAEFVGI